MNVSTTTACFQKPIHDIVVEDDFVAVACGSLTYNLWDGELIWIKEQKTQNLLFAGGLSSIIKIPSSQILIASSFDGSLHSIRDTNEKLEESRISAHNSPITMLDYSYSSHNFISSSLDGQIKLWSLDHDFPRQSFEFYQQRRSITGISCRPNEKQFLSVGEDTNIVLWDLNTPKPSCVSTQKFSSFCAAWSSHDNNYFLTGREDGFVQVFDVRKFEKAFSEINIHNDAIWTMNSCGNYFATGSDDGSIQILELTSELDL